MKTFSLLNQLTSTALILATSVLSGVGGVSGAGLCRSVPSRSVPSRSVPGPSEVLMS